MWIFIKLIFLASLCYFPLVLPNLLFKKRRSIEVRYRTIRKAVSFIFPALNIDFYIEHEQMLKTDHPFLIVSNHHSYLDPFLMIYLMKHPLRFLAKKEIRSYPIFGDATASIDALFIDRKDFRGQVKLLQTMKASMLEKNTRWVIYPEGTRNKSYSAPMLPFKPGSFKHAMEAKVDILPMVAYGFHRPLNPKIKLKRYPVQIDFLDPITPEMYANMSTVEVAQYVQDLIEKRSAEMIVKDQLLLKQTSR
jgi:1-acyl-sn-glycerol-3-phosphate acyltransferase